MAYSFQTFIFKAVLTSAQMNQVEINIRDHGHGASGVALVPDTGLSVNVALKNIDNAFTSSQTVTLASARLTIDALGGTPGLTFKHSGVQDLILASSALNILNLHDSVGAVRATWDLSTNPGTLTLGSIPDARLTSNIPLLNAANIFTSDQTVRKASAISIIDATTGNPLLRMQRAAANSVAIDSTATNILNFKNNADAARVSWDLSGTNGKLTQGDVPLARMEGQENSVVFSLGTMGSFGAGGTVVAGFTGLVASDFVIVSSSVFLDVDITMTGTIKSATEVNIHFHNLSSLTSVDPGSATYYARVIKRV